MVFAVGYSDYGFVHFHIVGSQCPRSMGSQSLQLWLRKGSNIQAQITRCSALHVQHNLTPALPQDCPACNYHPHDPGSAAQAGVQDWPVIIAAWSPFPAWLPSSWWHQHLQGAGKLEHCLKDSWDTSQPQEPYSSSAEAHVGNNLLYSL